MSISDECLEEQPSTTRHPTPMYPFTAETHLCGCPVYVGTTTHLNHSPLHPPTSRGQAVVSGSVRMVVRQLRTTDRPSVVIFYLALTTVLLSAVLCAAIPGQFVMPTNTTQVLLLLATGAGLEWGGVRQSACCDTLSLGIGLSPWLWPVCQGI